MTISCSSRSTQLSFKPIFEILLKYLGVNTLILTGIAGDNCVLFSANDAYMRDFRIIVPPDCSTSENPDQNRQVLMLMQRVLKAEITPSTEITFDGTRVPRGSQFRLP
jgi:nicotinamidase-related amidase